MRGKTDAAVRRRELIDALFVHVGNVEFARESPPRASEQRSDTPDADSVAEAIGVTLRRFGIRGCASRMAQEFGDHPEAAAERMRWVRSLMGLMRS